jgi:hypothetical protein
MPPKKKTINKALKTAIWDTYGGADLRKMKCVAGCGKDIAIENFEGGHVIPESLGGETTLYNLRPICGPCNRSMGQINMEKFAWDNFRVTLIQSPVVIRSAGANQTEICFSDWNSMLPRHIKDESDAQRIRDFIGKTVVFVGVDRFVKQRTASNGVYYSYLKKKDAKAITFSTTKNGSNAVIPLKRYMSQVKESSVVYTRSDFIPYSTSQPRLDSGVFNLFVGFKYHQVPAPKYSAKEIDPLLRYLFEAICSSDDALYNKMLDWLSHLIQSPDKRPNIIPSIQHGEVFFELIGRMIGDQYYSGATKSIPVVMKMLAVVDVSESAKLLDELLMLDKQETVTATYKKPVSVHHHCRYVIKCDKPPLRSDSRIVQLNVESGTASQPPKFSDDTGLHLYNYFLTRKIRPNSNVDELLEPDDNKNVIMAAYMRNFVAAILKNQIESYSGDTFEGHKKTLYLDYTRYVNAAARKNIVVAYRDFKKSLEAIFGKGKRVTINGKRAVGYSMSKSELSKLYLG